MTLDLAQLRRIEATHSGFLYQHLFAVAQLVTADEDVEALFIETDEDVEILTHIVRYYAQVKCLKEPLQPSDVAPILEQFDTIRLEHEAGRRRRRCTFVIFSRSEPSPSLAKAVAARTWPDDVIVVSPESSRSVLGVPAWRSLADAVEWTTEVAGRLPYCQLAPAGLAPETWTLGFLNVRRPDGPCCFRTRLG